MTHLSARLMPEVPGSPEWVGRIRMCVDLPGSGQVPPQTV